MEKVIEKVVKLNEVDSVRILIAHDDDCNPRDWDNLATMLCAHGRYRLGDENFSDADSIANYILDIIGENKFQNELKEYAEKKFENIFIHQDADGEYYLTDDKENFEPLSDANYFEEKDDAENELQDMKDDFINSDWQDELSYDEKMEIAEKYAYILPLYLYDHSGITMNTTGFSCGWDSGKVGEIFVTHERALKECPKHINENETDEQYDERILGYLRGEAKEYDQHLTGDVYWFKVEKLSYCECCGHEKDSEELDSCGGFFGMEDVIEEGILPLFKDEEKQVIADALK